ncbi:MAG: GNAT family N-acetyltransferase [Hyphomicrobiaceae bacterium]
MNLDLTLLARIEKAVVSGWPAAEVESIDGWLARATSGGSLRANTAAALDYCGQDLDRSIDGVIAFYRARGAAPRFIISPVSQPAGLDAKLAQRGFVRSSDCITMAKAVGTVPRTAVVVQRHDEPDEGWFAVYLQGLSDNRRAVAPSLVARVPRPRAFFSAVRDGGVIASGLSVLSEDLASVQCMASRASARRSGAATAVLAAIEAHAAAQGARWLYLQTEPGNVAAVALYQKYGFHVAGPYHTRDLAP